MNVFIISTHEVLVGFKSINPGHRMLFLDEDEDISSSSNLAQLIVSKHSDIAVFGPKIDEQIALETADVIRRTHPEIDCVSYREADDSFLPKAMKHGFRDVVSTEEGLMELQSTIALLEDSRKLLAENLSLGPDARPEKGIITVFGPKGGTGKTTIAAQFEFDAEANIIVDRYFVKVPTIDKIPTEIRATPDYFINWVEGVYNRILFNQVPAKSDKSLNDRLLLIHSGLDRLSEYYKNTVVH